jgi:BirA family biotin operon repressor/biotin-[acetyl-CoA-carboxylase] ligase
MTATELERSLALAGLSAPVHWHEVTGSTNADAAELAEADAPEWSVVGAGHQTAGRGRMGRSWLDRPGDALMASIVLRPSMPVESVGLLPLLAGVAWAESASEATGVEVRCKWPNDLLVGNDKVGGVLAESSVVGDTLRWVVIGSGVNLTAPDIDGAAGLGAGVDRVALLGGFLSRFHRGYIAAEPSEEIVARWSAASATLGRRVAAVAIDGRHRSGLAVAIDAWGRLVIETGDGPTVVASEEVEHLR